MKGDLPERASVSFPALRAMARVERSGVAAASSTMFFELALDIFPELLGDYSLVFSLVYIAFVVNLPQVKSILKHVVKRTALERCTPVLNPFLAGPSFVAHPTLLKVRDEICDRLKLKISFEDVPNLLCFGFVDDEFFVHDIVTQWRSTSSPHPRRVKIFSLSEMP